MPEEFSTIFSAVIVLVMFVGILVLAYYVTAFIGKRYPGHTAGSNCIKILDRVYLGQDRDVVLIEAAGQTFLLGVTPHHIEKISDVDPALLPEDLGKIQQPDFQNVLSTILKKNKGNSTDMPEEKKGKSDDGKMS